MQHPRARSYVLIWLSIVVGPDLLYALSAIALWNANEYPTTSRNVSVTLERPVLYNALSVPLWAYKSGMYRARQPKVTVVGSSRAMMIRDYFFRSSFYSLAGLVAGPNQLDYVERSLFAAHQPEVLIAILDFWTFCDKDRSDSDVYEADTKSAWPLWLLRLVFNGALSVGDIATLLLQRASTNIGNVEKVGITAVLRDIGFGNDGSYHYFGRLASFRLASPGARWEEASGRIARGEGQFVHGCAVATSAIDKLASIVDKITAEGTRVVLILGPMPKNILSEMDTGGHYEYITDLRRALKERLSFPVEYYDYHATTAALLPACEFLDGFHGGEVTYARILLDIIQRNPATVLAGSLDREKLSRLVRSHSGRITVDDNPLGEAYRRNFNLDVGACDNP